MRDLYIIQGSHFIPSMAPEDPLYQKILGVQEASRLIARELILSEGIERYFRDGVDSQQAELLNEYLLGETRLKQRSDSPIIQDKINWLRMLIGCREEGIDLQCAKTENDGLLEMLYHPTFKGEGYHPHLRVLDWIRTNYPKKLHRFLTVEVRSGTRQALLYLRDLGIYKNVDRQGSKANLLWMGFDHQLEEFYRKRTRTGFRVATVQLEDDLSYEIKLANREMPNGLIELVDRSVIRAKEIVQAELDRVAQ